MNGPGGSSSPHRCSVPKNYGRSASHHLASSAQIIAEAAHVTGKALAKVVIAISDDEPSILVLPASYRIDFLKLKRIMRADIVRLATKAEFDNLVQANQTDFGMLFEGQYRVYVDKHLDQNQTIFLAMGVDVIPITNSDFRRLAKPTIANFAIAM